MHPWPTADSRVLPCRLPAMKTPLAIGQILAWADAHRRATGRWPNQSSGPLAKAPSENWAAINDALKQGYRGLPGGSSLARLLAKHRNRRNLGAMPKLTVPQILAWADAHYRRQGSWPTKTSGPVVEAPAENWGTINGALRVGRRGLPGGLSLPKLLAEHRGRRPGGKERLSIRQILEWADSHYQRTGDWPVARSGPVPPRRVRIGLRSTLLSARGCVVCDRIGRWPASWRSIAAGATTSSLRR